MTDVRDAPAPAAQQGRTGPNPHGDFVWYELMTPDAEGSKAFYDAVVGWDVGEAAPESGYRMINVSGGGRAGGVLPLTGEMQQQGARPIWLGYINVNDVDQSIASIERAGGKVLMPAFDIPNIGRIAMVTDPQDAAFYVMKPIPPAGRGNEPSDVFSPDQDGRCGWNELSTGDPASARRFYGEQFGWNSDDFMPMGDMGDYRFFDHQGLRIGALCGMMQGQQPKWRFYFRVPSIAQAQEVAERKGGTVHIGPHEVPTGDWILIGSDPQGAEFALVGSK